MSRRKLPPPPTIPGHVWRVPSERNAFEGWLEGRPTDEERARRLDEVRKERLVWKPSDAAFQLVDQLRAFIGYRVRIQYWDTTMELIDDEAPFPVEANCLDLLLLNEHGFLQPFLQLTNLKELPTRRGYSPEHFLRVTPDANSVLAPVADFHTISAIEVTPS